MTLSQSWAPVIQSPHEDSAVDLGVIKDVINVLLVEHFTLSLNNHLRKLPGMVLILREWTSFKDYIERWSHIVELVYAVGPATEGTRVRVLAGRYGLDVTLPKDDPTLQEITGFLQENGAKRIDTVKEVDAFFV